MAQTRAFENDGGAVVCQNGLMIMGYAHVSTHDHNLALPLVALQRAWCKRIDTTEKASNATTRLCGQKPRSICPRAMGALERPTAPLSTPRRAINETEGHRRANAVSVAAQDEGLCPRWACTSANTS
jgi:hypothetical protein